MKTICTLVCLLLMSSVCYAKDTFKIVANSEIVEFRIQKTETVKFCPIVSVLSFFQLAKRQDADKLQQYLLNLIQPGGHQICCATKITLFSEGCGNKPHISHQAYLVLVGTHFYGGHNKYKLEFKILKNIKSTKEIANYKLVVGKNDIQNLVYTLSAGKDDEIQWKNLLN